VDKLILLKDWALKQQEESRKSNNLYHQFIKDFFDIILTRCDNVKDWEEMKEWVKKNQYSYSHAKDLGHFYKQVRDKIWSLEQSTTV